MIKLFYKPWGMLAGMTGGAFAGTLFKRFWKLLSDEDETPTATDRSRGWIEVVLAAGLEGAVYGAVKAFIDRGGAAGFEKATGTWPGRESDASKHAATSKLTERFAATKDGPSELSGLSKKAVIRRATSGFRNVNLTGLAAALTYYAVLPVVPGLIVLISILGLIDRNVVSRVSSQVEFLVPGSSAACTR